MEQHTDDVAAVDEPGALRDALRLARRELKWTQIEHEHQAEALQRVRRQRARLREQNDALAEALAGLLSRSYWAGIDAGRSRWRGTSDDDSEASLVSEVESSALFDGAWYVRRYPDVVASGLSPAAHLVRFGNKRGLDPSESFSTSRYLGEHPEAGGLPALVHHLRRAPRDGPGSVT